MPIRVRARAQTVNREPSPMPLRLDFELPDLTAQDDFQHVIQKLSLYFADVIELPSTFEQLRTTSAGHCLRVLVDHLSATCSNPAVVNALLALKWHYAADSENRGVSEARSSACEIVAWRFLTRLSEREAVEFCLYEIPGSPPSTAPRRPSVQDEEAAVSSSLEERSALLGRIPDDDIFDGHDCEDVADNVPDDDEAMPSAADAVTGSVRKRLQLLSSLSRLTRTSSRHGDLIEGSLAQGEDRPHHDPTLAFRGLNALEIAAIADAKRFLSQHIVQKIITGIWDGDIIYWDRISIHATKKPRYYSPQHGGHGGVDHFARLRVPKYLKSWEVLFFASFLILYYNVLLARDDSHLTVTEVLLFIWIAAFSYDELSEWLDAGSIFYATDVWNLFDLCIITIGFTFALLQICPTVQLLTMIYEGIVGVLRHDAAITDLAFDVLALEALFMIPRICSILSLSPYWGTLIPCLKEMGKDFFKFMVLVVIVYLGFLTTFSLVGRDAFNLSRMTWILTKIFFGSSYIGFDVMEEIDPVFGPPLMIIFITLTSILLTGSLTGILSNSFSRVITHAKEEYLYVYSVYVLEASTSNRLTHFYPPFNLLALVVFRPWRLMFGKNHKFRSGRIFLLKLTHFPIVAVIRLYELIRQKVLDDEFAGFKGPSIERRKDDAGGYPHRRLSTPGSNQLAVTAHRASNIPRPESGRRPEDDVEAPTDMEVQIGELSKKIDQLATIVLALQESHHATKSTSKE